MKSIYGLVLVLLIGMTVTIGAARVVPQFRDLPVIKKLSTYRGDHYPGFAEFRVHDIEFDELGTLMLTGNEPYEMLINVTYITTVYRFEDAKKTDHSTLVFTNYLEEPILIRQPYKDVISSIRKAMEGLVK